MSAFLLERNAARAFSAHPDGAPQDTTVVRQQQEAVAEHTVVTTTRHPHLPQCDRVVYG
jgi:hypothetical protein